MPPPKPKAKKASKVELDAFAEKHDTFALVYGDPVETVFSVMANGECPPELRLRAAEILMSYRYPRLKALEAAPSGNEGPVVQFVINTGPAPAPVAIDVTPAPKELNS